MALDFGLTLDITMYVVVVSARERKRGALTFHYHQEKHKKRESQKIYKAQYQCLVRGVPLHELFFF